MRYHEITETYTDDDIESREKSMLQDPVNPGYVTLYRAVPLDVNTFRKMDFVTASRKFAIEHAEHMALTEEEPYHVIKKMVDNTKDPIVYNAPNPGELFYYGPDVAGREIYVAKQWEEFD